MRVAPLHPVAWWAWAILLAAAAARITNPICLGLILVVAGWVVVSRRPQSTWARSYGTLLRLGALVVVIRVVVQALFGQRLPGSHPVHHPVPGPSVVDGRGDAWAVR